jgi:hypothetical protein
MSYYVMSTSTDPFTSVRLRAEWRKTTTNFWGRSRVPLEDFVSLPFQVEVELPKSGPIDLAAGFVSTACVFSDEMIEILRRVGVDNMDTYPTELYDTREGRSVVYRNYKMVRILNGIACLDKKKSVMVDLNDDTGLLKGGVDRMYVDERKTDGYLMFRPEPGIGAMLVHERVKKAIEAAGLHGLKFYDPADWGGF